MAEPGDEGAESSRAFLAVLSVYGGISAGLFVLFCLIRNRYVRVYNPRNESPNESLRCELATETFGSLSWIVGLLTVDEGKLLAQCGVDAVAFLRMLSLGLKLALLGCANAVWLIPVYRTTPDGELNAEVTDGLDKLSVGNVNAHDPRMAGTVLVSYILCFAAMYWLYKDLMWYIDKRHDYMSRTMPQNYTIFVDNIPPDLRSKATLGAYFKSFLHDAVLEINFVLDCKDLENLHTERSDKVLKLEHSVAVASSSQEGQEELSVWAPTSHGRVTKDRPTHKNSQGYQVDSIDTYAREVSELTHTINRRVDELEAKFVAREVKVKGMMNDPNWIQQAQFIDEPKPQDTQDVAKQLAANAKNKITAFTGDHAFVGDSAFITFKTLQATASATLMLHHHTPFALEVQRVPAPKFVFWKNVGLPFARVQVTTLAAGALTVLTCLVWTVPVGLVATFTKVESLKQRLGFLETASDNFPLLDDILALLGPIALIILTNVLPIILRVYCELEGHIGEDTLQASLFSKLTLFMIVQVFFVSAVSGSIFDQVDLLISDPGKIVDILGQSLPTQSITFMSYTIVKFVVGAIFELLRVVPLAMALIHSSLAPQLTEKQRTSEWMGIRPLAVPGELDMAFPMAQAVLIFIVMFVYSCLAPVSSFITALGFFVQLLVYTNQFVYVYDPSNDTLGKLWPKVAGYVVVCMIISQITILGVIGLKQGEMAPAMIPLLIITILFWRFINKQHFRVAETLPLPDAMKKDKENAGMEFTFVRRKYRQEALFKVSDDDLDLHPVMAEPNEEGGASRKSTPAKPKGAVANGNTNGGPTSPRLETSTSPPPMAPPAVSIAGTAPPFAAAAAVSPLPGAGAMAGGANFVHPFMQSPFFPMHDPSQFAFGSQPPMMRMDGMA